MEDRTVSLNAVIERIKNQYNEHNKLIPKWLSIGDLPSVEPQEGHWIDKTDWYECSECGESHSYCHKYCPYCGCRMVEPQESEGKE